MSRVATNLFAGIVISTGLLSCTDNPPADFTLTDTSRNRDIHYQVWLPPVAEAAPLVPISHGTRGDIRDHRWLTGALVNRGFAVAALISSDELQQPTGQ